jgi:hypothetical protein
MARDLDERGAAFLKGGKTSQSLTLSELLDTVDGPVMPKLKVLAFSTIPVMLLILVVMASLKCGLVLPARPPTRRCV